VIAAAGRPARGPLRAGLNSAVPLLFRGETIVVVVGLTAASLAWMLLLLRFSLFDWMPTLPLPGGRRLYTGMEALTLSWELLRAACILLLLPVALGARGLRPGLVLRHLGPVTLVGAVLYGLGAAFRAAGPWMVPGLSGDSWWTEIHRAIFRALPAIAQLVESWVVVWGTGRLLVATDPRGRADAAPARVGLWPGFVIALPGLILPYASALLCSSLEREFGDPLAPGTLIVNATRAAWWNLALLFPALWTARYLEERLAREEPLPQGLPSGSPMGE